MRKQFFRKIMPECLWLHNLLGLLKSAFSYHNRHCFFAVVAYKIILFSCAYFVTSVVPDFQLDVFARLRHWPLNGVFCWQSPFATWDGAHYLYVSENGYEKGTASCAFYPLWPFIIRTYSFLFAGSHFWTGMILANLISVIGILLFHKFVREIEDRRAANWAVIFLLAFPGTIFLSLIYTEPLYFLLSVAFLSLLLRQRYWFASLVAFFLPLTKAIGIFSMPALAFCLWVKRRPISNYLALFFPALGYLCYFLTMYFWTGNPFEGFEAQKQFPTQPSIAKIFDFSFLQCLISPDSWHSSTGSIIDRLFFLIFVALLPWIFRQNQILGIYAFFCGFIPAASALFISYSRNVVMCFPIFIVLGKLGGANRHKVLIWSILMVLWAGQLFFLARYLNFYWAG